MSMNNDVLMNLISNRDHIDKIYSECLDVDLKNNLKKDLDIIEEKFKPKNDLTNIIFKDIDDITNYEYIDMALQLCFSTEHSFKYLFTLNKNVISFRYVNMYGEDSEYNYYLNDEGFSKVDVGTHTKWKHISEKCNESKEKACKLTILYFYTLYLYNDKIHNVYKSYIKTWKAKATIQNLIKYLIKINEIEALKQLKYPKELVDQETINAAKTLININKFNL